MRHESEEASHFLTKHAFFFSRLKVEIVFGGGSEKPEPFLEMYAEYSRKQNQIQQVPRSRKPLHWLPQLTRSAE